MLKTGKAQGFIIVFISSIFIMMVFTPAQSFQTEGNSNYFDFTSGRRSLLKPRVSLFFLCIVKLGWITINIRLNSK